MRHIIRMTNLELTRIMEGALHVPEGQLKILGFEGIFDKSTFAVRVDWEMVNQFSFCPPPRPPPEPPPIPQKIRKHEVR
jgi:hypothetical protein